ncbi:MAG TPA: zinc-dependent metalloprotease [Acidimicrobiales bacterium]
MTLLDPVPPVVDAVPSAGAVGWDTAERVAGWVGSRTRMPAPYRPDLLQAEFAELTEQAEELVATSTGLRSAAGPARARVTDRSGWVSANVASFQRLLGPHFDRLDPSRLSEGNPVLSRLSGPLATAGRAATGAQMGVVLGWLSTRVLGQYDLLLTEEAADEQDLVYFVGPNVVALERQHGFEPREFHLWLALHEVTHRCQFTAIPWMRDYFVSLVEEGIGSLEPDPSRLATSLKRMTDEIRAGRNPLDDNGALGLVATPEQLEGLHRIQALMSLLEGHGDVTMDRAGAADIPSAAHFSKVLRARRKQSHGLARILQQLIGIEAKLRQYEEGERFIAAVEESGGPELLDHAWRGPEWLPSLEEIRDPSAWIDRIGVTPAPALPT